MKADILLCVRKACDSKEKGVGGGRAGGRKKERKKQEEMVTIILSFNACTFTFFTFILILCLLIQDYESIYSNRYGKQAY